MRVICKLGLIALVIVMALPVHNASALPSSMFAEAEGNWEGFKTYRNDENTIYAKVDFTVYDTLNTGAEADFVNSLINELSLTGRFIYAYQVWNHFEDSTEDITSFKLMNLDGNDITQSLDDIGSYDYENNDESVEPDDAVADEALWEFDDWDSDQRLIPGNRSWFLIFSSDSGPVAGDYKIESIESNETDPPVPDPDEVPEPATLILLGIGSAMVLKRRRRSI